MTKTRNFFVYIFLLISIFYIYKSYQNLDYNSNTIETSLEIDITDNFISLNRYIYKDGFYYEELSKDIINKITGCSFPKEFDSKYTNINYDDLRYVKVKHYDFNNNIIDGELIVNYKVANEILEIFYELYKKKYPIEKITLVEEYNCIDELSMEDNNTSSFNYRLVENSNVLSWHAFGLAIDINPLYNPYIYGNIIYPYNAELYIDRTLDIMGLISHDDLAYKLFTKYGWSWGGDFKYTKDYQHFYKEGILEEKVREIKY